MTDSLRHRVSKKEAPVHDQLNMDGDDKDLTKKLLSSPVNSPNNPGKNLNPNGRYEMDWLDHFVDGVMRYDFRTTMTTLALTVAAFATRLWNIHKADFVVWDEAHFGKFGSHYLKREFYFDVHPPLGKILVGLAGALSGYRGDFEFKSGEKYPEGLNYTGMRVFLSSFGSLMVPFAYLTCLELGMRKRTALLAAIMVLCDNAYLAISRYILLDSMLLFFTVTTVFCWSVFRNMRRRAFTAEWWFWLCMTGANIGCVSSVKWVGFFVTAMVGFSTIEDLWNMFGDLRMPKVRYAMHFGARVVGLILIPLAVYTASFKLHFWILENSGPGDAQMSSLFQANLRGSELKKSPEFIAYGSKISLKNNGYGGGLLHSHIQTFPHGSQQQQVTCYHHKDTNNDWIVKFTREEEKRSIDDETIHFLKHNDTIRLVHEQTGRNLHSHPLAAPVTKIGWEVSGYGNETIGDANDYWVVEIVDDILDSKPDRVHSLTTRFRLRHQLLNCYLRSHNVILPEWGFKQAEVMCDKYRGTDLHNVWNIEQHWNDRLPPGNAEAYKTSFIHDFIHLNVAMMTSNNALVPDPSKEPDGLTSTPGQWPLATVGLRMCGWGDDQHKVYLIGNPIVWWYGAGSLALFCGLWFLYILRFKRGFSDWTPSSWYQFEYVGKWMLIGWMLHFIPFGIMARVTYLHHYFPALYFAILAGAFMTEHLGSYLPKVLSKLLTAVVGAGVIASFLFFAPLSLGFDGPASAYANRKWLATWTMTD